MQRFWKVVRVVSIVGFWLFVGALVLSTQAGCEPFWMFPAEELDHP